MEVPFGPITKELTICVRADILNRDFNCCGNVSRAGSHSSRFSEGPPVRDRACSKHRTQLETRLGRNLLD